MRREQEAALSDKYQIPPFLVRVSFPWGPVEALQNPLQAVEETPAELSAILDLANAPQQEQESLALKRQSGKPVHCRASIIAEPSGTTRTNATCPNTAANLDIQREKSGTTAVWLSRRTT